MALNICYGGGVLTSFIAYFLNSYYSANLINYPTSEQIKDILPTFLISFCSSGIHVGSFFLGYFCLRPVARSSFNRNIVSSIYI